VKIKEGARERIQEFKGVILYIHNKGNNSSFTVRRVASNGIGVERTFMLRSHASIRLSWIATAKSVVHACIFCVNRSGKSARLNRI